MTTVTAIPSGTQGFLAAVAESLGHTFIKMTLGKPDAASEIKKIVIKPVSLRDKPALSFVYSYATKDITKNFSHAGGLAEVSTLLSHAFKSATLFTSLRDLTIAYAKDGVPRVTKNKASLKAPASLPHDRAKAYAVDPARPYLHDLGLTLGDGRVKPSMYAKFKQICHFIDIAGDLIRASHLADKPDLSVIDIGAGKGYLTFALYDHLTARLGKSVAMTGIEERGDLVTAGTEIARRAAFSGLTFEAARAADMPLAAIDLLIALHACDTATDDAIANGIAAQASIIIVAPCCQHEIAPQLSHAAEALRGLTKFGLFKQRQADLVTDAARCLLFEAHGYKVKVIEFVSTEHTAKNLLLAAVRSADVDRDAARRQYEVLKAHFRFESHHLELRLAALARAGTRHELY